MNLPVRCLAAQREESAFDLLMPTLRGSAATFFQSENRFKLKKDRLTKNWKLCACVIQQY